MTMTDSSHNAAATTVSTLASPAAPPAQQSDNANKNIWRALGHYAVGELSVGRTHNALYAYRLLSALEPSDERWKLGRAFCALNLHEISEAEKSLASMSDGSFAASEVGQEKLLRQCQQRLVYLQQQKSLTLKADQPQDKKQGRKQDGKTQDSKIVDVGKVLRFPNNASHS